MKKKSPSVHVRFVYIRRAKTLDVERRQREKRRDSFGGGKLSARCLFLRALTNKILSFGVL